MGDAQPITVESVTGPAGGAVLGDQDVIGGGPPSQRLGVVLGASKGWMPTSSATDHPIPYERRAIPLASALLSFSSSGSQTPRPTHSPQMSPAHV